MRTQAEDTRTAPEGLPPQGGDVGPCWVGGRGACLSLSRLWLKGRPAQSRGGRLVPGLRVSEVSVHRRGATPQGGVRLRGQCVARDAAHVVGDQRPRDPSLQMQIYTPRAQSPPCFSLTPTSSPTRSQGPLLSLTPQPHPGHPVGENTDGVKALRTHRVPSEPSCTVSRALWGTPHVHSITGPESPCGGAQAQQSSPCGLWWPGTSGEEEVCVRLVALKWGSGT